MCGGGIDILSSNGQLACQNRNFNQYSQKSNKNFTIVKCKADGHCLIEAVLRGIHQIKGETCNKKQFICQLRSAALKYYDAHPDVVGEVNSYETEMNNYLDRKIYNSDFGDLVPYIIAESFGINLHVFSSNGITFKHSLSIHSRNCRASSIDRSAPYMDICVNRTGEHYDFLMPKCREAYFIGNLKLLYHNTYGLTQNDLIENRDYYSKFDFFIAAETWADKNTKLEFDGYKPLNYARPDRHRNAIRGSGGMYIFIKNSIVKGIEVLHHRGDFTAWFKFKKDFFGWDSDLHLAASYVAPVNSPHLHINAFDTIVSDIAKISPDDKKLLLLDANAHTNSSDDFITQVSGNDNGLRELLYHGTGNVIQPRKSEDMRPVDEHGKGLLNLCKATGMFIGNSRLPGNDLNKGGITWISRGNHKHVGVLDYAVLSPNLFNEVESFNIGNFLPNSDHAPIELTLKCNISTGDKEINRSVSTWEPHHKYEWNRERLSELKAAISSKESIENRNTFRNSIIDMESVDSVAESFDNFIQTTCNQVFKLKKCKPRVILNRNNIWHDKECADVRADAVKAGERVNSESDRLKHLVAVKRYRAVKQRKKRQHQAKSVSSINALFKSNPSKIWAEIDKICSNNSSSSREPSSEEFFLHFQKLANSDLNNSNSFDDEYEKSAKEFIDMYTENSKDKYDLELQILNDNISSEEIKSAINQLKNNRSPGSDYIPPEFLKCMKDELADDLPDIFNYFIEKRQFPRNWAEGLRSAIFKNGDRMDPNNYRGITVPRIFEKVFEQIITNRLQFINEAFNHIDQTNGGFLKGRRTADNIFILLGLIQKQLLLNKKLYVCFIDFSKAFDLISRYILFYKIMKGGWHGRVIDTLKDLYGKTHFRVKANSKLSGFIDNTLGVNQGGVASGLLFRKYMSDLSKYLEKHFGIPIDENIITHLLWADDLVLISDSLEGIKKQLKGLNNFCKNNRMIINELKTKIMVFGSKEKIELKFNGSDIEHVEKYKFLGVIITATHRINSDPFKLNYTYLCDQARKSLFAIKQKLKNVGHLPPVTMFYIFNCMLKPILTYCSDIWGVYKTSWSTIDKFFLHFAKCVLGVRSNTSNLIVYGETGQIAPHVSCIYNSITYFNRVLYMDDNTLVKQVFNELAHLHECGFQNHNWFSNARVLVDKYQIEVNSNQSAVKNLTRNTLTSNFINGWFKDIHNSDKNPIARTYKLFKLSYGMEPYLNNISNFKHRKALTKLRTSTHSLKIESDRHQSVIPDINSRACPICGDVETEIHFIVKCPLYKPERDHFFNKIGLNNTNLHTHTPLDIFCYIMNLDQCHHHELACYIYKCFNKRQDSIEST